MELVRLSKIYLNVTYTKVRIGKNMFNAYPVQKGLKQGDALIPLLLSAPWSSLFLCIVLYDGRLSIETIFDQEFLVPFLSHMTAVHTLTPNFFKTHFISPSHLHLDLQSGVFPSGFPTEILYVWLVEFVMGVHMAA
jgi:hypothetical protein